MTDELPQRATPSTERTNVNKLGYYLDGWADLVEGMGTKAGQIRDDVLARLGDRKMPACWVTPRSGYVALLDNERRDYVISSTQPGATTTVYIAEHGNDLFASWRSFIQPVWNKDTILIVGIVAAILGLLTGGIRRSNILFGPRETQFSFFGWIAATIAFALIGAAILAVAGKILKNNPWAFFFIEPTVFDAEDITAMNLSVHYTILRALDTAGIDTSKLRLKQTFKGGRRGEEI